MPTLDQHWAPYREYTGDLSKLSRQLAFADAAICWFFKTPEVTFPDWVLYSLAAVVLFFAFDTLQYLAGALSHRVWIRRTEKRMWGTYGNLDQEVEKPDWLDHLPFTLFLLKMLALLAAFASLGAEFFKRLTETGGGLCG